MEKQEAEKTILEYAKKAYFERPLRAEFDGYKWEYQMHRELEVALWADVSRTTFLNLVELICDLDNARNDWKPDLELIESLQDQVNAHVFDLYSNKTD